MSSEIKEAISEASEKIVGWGSRAQQHPFVERVLSHPAFKNETFKDPIIIGTVVGVIIILIVFSFLSTTKQAKRRGTPTVLLVGPPDSGKTSLFAKLSQGERPSTHTSLAPSTSTISLPSDGRTKTVRIVDLAGHARLRDQVAQHIETSDAVAFVVDIVSLVRNAAAVAEELPPLLTKLAGTASRRGLSSPPLRLCVVAHKTDLLIRPAPSSTLSPPEITEQARTTANERVRSILTREMERLKAACGAGGVGGRIEGMSGVASGGGFWSRLFGGGNTEPDANAEDDEALIWGGNGPFRWEDVEGVEVDWAVTGLGPASSEKATEEQARGNGLDELTDFMWGL